MSFFGLIRNKNFQIYKLGFEEAEKPEIKLPTFTGSWRKQRRSRKHLLLLHDYAKVFDYVITINCGKFLEMGISDHLTCLLRNLYVGQKATWTWNNRLVPNWERGMSRLYIVTLLI